jgi:uncharacterized protein (TIGR03067 family)
MTVTHRNLLWRSLSCGLLLLLAAFWSGSRISRAMADEKVLSAGQKALQGTWVADGDGIDSTWTFKDDTVKASVQGVEYSCKSKIEVDAKPHPTADLTIEDGPDESKGKVSKGIYKLDGEKLKLCVSLPGMDRPKDFEQVDGEAYLFELKKEKK